MICHMVLGIWCMGNVLLAKPKPDALFGDHAVLQAGEPVNIWGTAKPGEFVKVSFRGVDAKARADDSGFWKVQLPALEPSAIGSDLVFEGKSRVLSRDVIVGDAWLYAGQSNMGMTISGLPEGKRPEWDSRLPVPRQFRIDLRTETPAPSERIGRWIVSNEETFEDFPALGFVFAREVAMRTGRPQGILNATWSGSPIEAWIPKDRGWTARNVPGNIQIPPGGAYEGMVKPLGGMGLRGILWYQGEANTTNPEQYSQKLNYLIRDWRKNFASTSLPFFVVQLPRFGAPEDSTGRAWAHIREAQAVAVEGLPGTHLICTIDLGEELDIHPTDKIPLGIRIAESVFRQIYLGRQEETNSVSVSAQKSTGLCKMVFAEPDIRFVSPKPPEKSPFELAGEDGIFKTATVWQEDNSLILWAPDLETPQFVRHAFSNFPQPCLVFPSGLPFRPFQMRIKPEALKDSHDSETISSERKAPQQTPPPPQQQKM